MGLLRNEPQRQHGTREQAKSARASPIGQLRCGCCMVRPLRRGSSSSVAKSQNGAG